MKLFLHLKEIFLSESDRHSLWLPIAFTTGIAIYFALSAEPWIGTGFILFIFSAMGLVIFRKKRPILYTFIFLSFITAGFACVQIKAHVKSAPVIGYNMGGVALEGTIENLELVQSGYRVTLSTVQTDRIESDQIPKLIRLRVNGMKVKLAEGQRIMVRATLMPPGFPFEPGAYDFARRAWFDQIGAVGFTTSVPKIIRESDSNNWLDRTRKNIAYRFLEILPKNQASVAIPLVTGEQGTVSKKTFDSFRDAGIAHVLSVSGLHMVLIAGLVMGFFRLILSLIPWIALRFDIKKISSAIALFITFLYLLISGMAVPAVRSFFMLAVVLIAIFFNRQALSVRNVCWAAFGILLFVPETLVSASFQLSFGAVVALVCAYETLSNPIRTFLRKRSKVMRWILGLFFAFMITNIVAAIATAPYVFYHFNRYPTYGILGNLLTSSAFTFVIMPTLLIGVLLMPFGLDLYPIKIAGYFLEKVVEITDHIASLPHASLIAPAMPTWGLCIATIGGLWLCLWKKNWRYAGAIFFIVGTITFVTHHEPDILVSQGGKLFAIKGDDNKLSLMEGGKDGRIREAWLERAGEFPEKYDRNRALKNEPQQVKGYTVTFKAADCGVADIAFIPEKEQTACTPHLKIERRALWKYGAHAIYIDGKNIRVETASDLVGNRLWNPNYK